MDKICFAAVMSGQEEVMDVIFLAFGELNSACMMSIPASWGLENPLSVADTRHLL